MRLWRFPALISNEKLRHLIILFSFTLPILILYLFEPLTFQKAWKGRFPYLVFIWLFSLELALCWNKLPGKKFKSALWIVMVAIVLVVPTAFVITKHLFGLNEQIVEVGKLVGVPFHMGEWFLLFSWPLSLEYLLLAILFSASIVMLYGIQGLKWFAISVFFIAATGISYMVDTFYPFGTLVTVQNLVPITASSVALVLNSLGYGTHLSHYTLVWHHGSETTVNATTILEVTNGGLQYPITLYWPCAGIQSLILYTFVILLFLKYTSFSFKKKIVYITIGALGTFFVNVLRIISVVLIGLSAGGNVAEAFHGSIGELYFIVWIVLYPLAIVKGRETLAKLFTFLKVVLQKSSSFLKDSFDV